MKKCTWCGKEYSDDATACSIDGQPLISTLLVSFAIKPIGVLRLFLIFGSYLGLNYFLLRPGDHWPNHLSEPLAKILLFLTTFALPLTAYYFVLVKTFTKVKKTWKEWSYATLLSLGFTLISALAFLFWMGIMFFQIPFRSVAA